MRRIVEFVVGLVLDWITWEEKTRARRRDDPVEAELKLLNRQVVLTLLAALVASGAWGALRISSLEAAPGPFAAVAHTLVDWAAAGMGWLATAVWTLAVYGVVCLATYRPQDHES